MLHEKVSMGFQCFTLRMLTRFAAGWNGQSQSAQAGHVHITLITCHRASSRPCASENRWMHVHTHASEMHRALMGAEVQATLNSNSGVVSHGQDKTLPCRNLRQGISTQYLMALYYSENFPKMYISQFPHPAILIHNTYKIVKDPQVIPICLSLASWFPVNTVFATPAKHQRAFKYSGQVKMTPPSWHPGSRWIFVTELHYNWTYTSQSIFYSRHLTMSFLTFLLTGWITGRISPNFTSDLNSKETR